MRAPIAAVIAAIAAITACHTRAGGPSVRANDAGATAPATVAAPAPPFAHALEPMDGSHLKVTVVQVTYGPGQSSKPHSHPCPVVGYILEGSYRTQVRGEREVVYSAGESFYEAANGAHVVSANASTEKPVRFLAYFTCDHETPLLVPVPDSAGTGKP